MSNQLTAKEVAQFVIGKKAIDGHAFEKFFHATVGKTPEFLLEVYQAIPDLPGEISVSSPGSLQRSAHTYLGKKFVRMIAPEVIQATEKDQFKIAQKCRQYFPGWTVDFLTHEVEAQIDSAPNPGIVYNILAMVLAGECMDMYISVQVTMSV